MTLPRGTLDWKTAGKKPERIEEILICACCIHNNIV
jgi:hypothetical protein